MFSPPAAAVAAAAPLTFLLLSSTFSPSEAAAFTSSEDSLVSFWDWDLLWGWDVLWDSSGSSPKSNLGRRRDVFAAASGVGLLGALPPAIAKDCDCHYVLRWVRYDDDGLTDTEQTMIERCGECASVGDSSGYWLEVRGDSKVKGQS